MKKMKAQFILHDGEIINVDDFGMEPRFIISESSYERFAELLSIFRDPEKLQSMQIVNNDETSTFYRAVLGRFVSCHLVSTQTMLNETTGNIDIHIFLTGELNQTVAEKALEIIMGDME